MAPPLRTFDDGFFPSSRARDIALGNGAADNDVLTEINELQLLVDTAARNGALEVVVGISEGNDTAFTDAVTGPIYREAFAGTSDSFTALFPNDDIRVYKIRMERVIGYFTRLGYAVRRDDQTSGVPTTFNWIIRW